jgi:pyruvate kinase
MVDEGVTLEKGGEATLTTETLVGESPNALPVQYQGLPRSVRAGDRILVDDGLLELCVLSTTKDSVRCKVVTGGVVRSKKGLNLPRAPRGIPSITNKDRADLAFALQQGVDWVALSFVRAADEVVELKELIAELSSGAVAVPVMAKIEKPEALDNIDEIMDVVDAVMVARGDLGIEIQPEEVPMVQKALISSCNRTGIPVVTATQMLDSMIRNPRPTRAEASDVANAILDGTDAIMLSGETSIGAYPLEAVRTMVEIAERVEMDCSLLADERDAGLEDGVPRTIANAVSRSARLAAHDLGAAAIVTPTSSGYTARLMSHHRPCVPVIAVTPDPAVQRQLSLYWGVTPLYAPRADSTDAMLLQAVGAAREQGLVQEGDILVMTAGAATSEPGTTDLMHVVRVD